MACWAWEDRSWPERPGDLPWSYHEDTAMMLPYGTFPRLFPACSQTRPAQGPQDCSVAFWAFLTLAVTGSIGLWVRGFGQRPVPKCLLAGFSSELQVCLFPKFSYLKDSGNRNTSHSVGMGFGDPQHVMRSGFEVFSLLSLAFPSTNNLQNSGGLLQTISKQQRAPLGPCLAPAKPRTESAGQAAEETPCHSSSCRPLRRRLWS